MCSPLAVKVQNASKLNDTGIIIANDISLPDVRGLVKNIELAGIKNCHVICEDLINIQDKLKNSFDKILIDAPCSGENV